MILKKKIPNDFYKLFRTKNREAYMQFVTAIYEENNEVYASQFEGTFPARSAVAVKTLPKNGLVEIEVIAVKE